MFSKRSELECLLDIADTNPCAAKASMEGNGRRIWWFQANQDLPDDNIMSQWTLLNPFKGFLIVPSMFGIVFAVYIDSHVRESQLLLWHLTRNLYIWATVKSQIATMLIPWADKVNWVNSKRSCLTDYKGLWQYHQRKELEAGFPLYLYENTVFPSIKVLLRCSLSEIWLHGALILLLVCSGQYTD